MKVLLYQFHLENQSPWNNNNHDNYWELSSKSCKKYADKWGYDYIFDYHKNKNTWTPWFLPETHWEQFRAIEYLKDYDAVLFVDSDVLIKPYSPNIVSEYQSFNTNLILNTRIGNQIFNYSVGTLSINTGVVLWYNKSKYTDDLYNLTPKKYAYFNNDIFSLGKFLQKRENKRWWEDWQDFEFLIGKLSSGQYNEERFFSIIIEMFVIPTSHLHHKYNYRFTSLKNYDILSDNVHFIHYQTNSKNLMQKHYNLIMEQ
jgi:hypothetical protein